MQIVEAVNMAPLRRVDNSITRLYNSARLLRLHLNIMEGVRKAYNAKWRWWAAMATVSTVSVAGFGAGALLGGLPQLAVPLFTLSLGVGVGSGFLAQRSLAKDERELLSSSGLDKVFRERYVVALAQHDEFIVSLWDRVKQPLQTALRTMGANKIPKVSGFDLDDLDRVIEEEVPHLRKAATKAGSIRFNRSFAERKVPPPLY